MIACSSFFVMIAIFYAMHSYSALEFKSWTEAKAVIKQVNYPKVIRRVSNSTSKGGMSYKEVYSVEMLYTYSVNGKTYENDKIIWNDEMIIKSETGLDFVKTLYKNGAEIDIIYNPDNAQESYVETPSVIKYILLMFLMFFLSAFSGLYFYRKIKGE